MRPYPSRRKKRRRRATRRQIKGRRMAARRFFKISKGDRMTRVYDALEHARWCGWDPSTNAVSATLQEASLLSIAAILREAVAHMQVMNESLQRIAAAIESRKGGA